MTRRVATLFWLAFTGVAMLQAWTYWESSGREDFDARQDQSQKELTGLRAVWTDLMEATSAARGYAFTGQPKAQAAYARVVTDLRGRLEKLQELAGDARGGGALHGRRRSAATAEADATAELVKVVNGVIAEMDQAVAAREAGRVGAAAAGAAEPTWQDGGLLQRTRELVREIEADEEASIARYAEAERASVDRNRALFAVVTVVDVLLAGIAFGTLGRFLEQRRRAEDGLERAREAAESARAEAVRASLAKDRVLATVSHDLRTPLNGILMWAQVLQGRGLETSDGDVSEAAEAIASSARA
jgi:signal transduction histidine kinase